METNAETNLVSTDALAVLKNEVINQINAYKAANKIYDHDRLLMHVYDQFSSAIMSHQYENHRENFNNYTMFCEELLVLLANPKISSNLRGIFQEKAGEMLFNMMRFFKYINDPVCNVELDLYEVNQDHFSEVELADLIKKYQKKIEKATRRF